MSRTNEHVTFGVTSHEITEVLRIDKEGMHYKGQVIHDGGEAHKVFLTVMQQMQKEVEEHQRPWTWYRDPMAMLAVGVCAGLVVARYLV